MGESAAGHKYKKGQPRKQSNLLGGCPLAFIRSGRLAFLGLNRL